MSHIRLFLLVFAVSLMSGCVEEYNVPEEDFVGDLIIEGRIVSGEESVIYLSRTIPLNNVGSVYDFVFNAEVRIIGDDGFQSEKADNIEDGTYVVNAGELNKDVRYAVEIKTGGKTYRSDFQLLLDTPEIDAVTWKESPEQVSIYVSTTGNGQRHYMWTFEEDWQYYVQHDLLDFSQGLPHYMLSYYPDLDLSWGYNAYYYCYKHSASNKILIYSSQSLTDDVVPKMELVSYDNTSHKLTSLYSILVKQWALDENGYNYYSMMKKLVEDTGGLFPLMPVELYGNVHCISDPSAKVYGYVLASPLKEKRIFIYARDFKKYKGTGYYAPFYTTEDKDNHWMEKWGDIYKAGGVYYSYPTDHISDAFVIYPRGCVDCREHGGVTERPSFWPEGEPNYPYDNQHRIH